MVHPSEKSNPAVTAEPGRLNALTVVKLVLQMLARTGLSATQRRLVQTALLALDRHIQGCLEVYEAQRPRALGQPLARRAAGPTGPATHDFESEVARGARRRHGGLPSRRTRRASTRGPSRPP